LTVTFKRLWGVMNAIASTLSDQDSADVAVYFARGSGGLQAVSGGGAADGGRSLHQRDPIIRLVFAGDSERGIRPAWSAPRIHRGPAPDLRPGQPDCARTEREHS